MYRVNEVIVSLEEDSAREYSIALSRHFNLEKSLIKSFKIIRKSLDARKKSNIHYKFSFDVELDKTIEQKVVNKYKLVKAKQISKIKTEIKSPKTVVVVGSGPAGLFCANKLSENKVKVILLERGESVDDRVKTVNNLLKNGKLNKESNIQFGEGGAGTFSDGKLNTGINSPLVNEVLKTFYECGASENVLYDAKPHIGTDKLREVVKNLRNKIIKNGGEVLFNSKFTDFELKNNKILVKYNYFGKENVITADNLVLAIGYSSRDTLRQLYFKGLTIEQKAFSIGYRIEHLQEDINISQYGENYNKLLPPAEYKLFTHLPNGRTVYTFCMCPGGEVVPAINNENEIVTNGMSYHDRAGENANSAILVNVNPSDYNSSHPLAGLEFQEKLETTAFDKGNGKFVVSKVEDFLKREKTLNLGKVKPSIKPCYKLGNVYELLPQEFAESIRLGIVEFGKKIKGFDKLDAVLTGIETRSSAPFMVPRNQDLETSIKSVYAVGEGAGMAGGIVSSAVDGIKIATKIIDNIIKEEIRENC